jgi:hypothetical protein
MSMARAGRCVLSDFAIPGEIAIFEMEFVFVQVPAASLTSVERAEPKTVKIPDLKASLGVVR